MTVSDSAVPPATAPVLPAARRRGRLSCLLKIALLCGVLYLVGGFWFVPWLARLALVHYGSAELGRPLQVAALRFDPFAAVLTAEGITLGERGGGAADLPALSVARVRVDFEPLALASGRILLRALNIEQPVLRLTRAADGALNWGDLWPYPSADEGGLDVVVHDVRVRDGRIVWQDGQGDGHAAIEVAGIELDLPRLDRLQHGAVPGGRLPRLAARIGPQELAVAGAPHGEGIRFMLVAEAVDLAPWAHTAGFLKALGALQGRLDARLALDFATAARSYEHFTLSGTLQLHEPALRTADARLAVSAHAAELTLGDSHPLQQRWHVQTLQLAAPRLHYLAAPAASATGTSTAAEPDAPAASAVSSAALQWRIDAASLRDGQIELVFDEHRTLALQAVHAGWQQPAGEPHGNLRVEAQDGHAARLTLSATLDPALTTPAAGRATLTALALPHYEGWLAPLVPEGRVVQGVLDAAADWRVVPGAEGEQWSVHAGVLTLRNAELRLRSHTRTTPPLLRVRRLHADAISAESAARRLRIGSVEALAPRLALQRTKAGFDAQALWPEAETPPAPAARQDAGEVGTDWHIETGAIRIRDGELALDDRRARPPVRSLLRGIVLDVPDVTALQGWWQAVESGP